MWRESAEAWDLSPAHLVLLEEACRIADRLNKLDGAIREADIGDVQALLAESRQQQSTLKGILGELRAGQQKAAKPPSSSGSGGAGVADLSARIAERRGEASS
ncbi:hypothetical protein HC362_29680 [Streptomyces sp. 891-h]|nr:hypothetical protein HC362_29680 [Streptomyces sp. 891-h]